MCIVPVLYMNWANRGTIEWATSNHWQPECMKLLALKKTRSKGRFYFYTNASWSDDLLWPSCLIRVMSDLWPIHFLTCPFSDLSIRWTVHFLTCPFADLSIRWPVHSLTCTCLIRDLFGRWLHVVQYLYRLSILYVYVSLDY